MHGSESGAAFLAGWGASSVDLKGSGAALLPHALAPWVKIEFVKIRQPSANRWALWAFAMALLLKAAMPLIATASAELQGKTLVEVCTVYGVSLLPLATLGQEQPAPEPMAQHAANIACSPYWPRWQRPSCRCSLWPKRRGAKRLRHAPTLLHKRPMLAPPGWRA